MIQYKKNYLRYMKIYQLLIYQLDDYTIIVKDVKY